MALRINTQLELTTGLTVEAGAYVKVGINLPERDSDPAMINLGVYKNITAYDAHKEKIMNVANLPLSFWAVQDENIIDPVYVHQLAINHIATSLNIDPSLIMMQWSS